MAYTQAAGRAFWLDFDQQFKFGASANGLMQKYTEMGGYSAPSQVWRAAAAAGEMRNFEAYVVQVAEPLKFVAGAHKKFMQDHFQDDEDLIRVLQDFAFGVLASPNAPNRQNEPVHTMNGGIDALDYLSWFGFIEGAIQLFPGDEFWTKLRWMVGMAWELQVKSRPQELFPNMNEPLYSVATQHIREKWQAYSEEQVREEFRNYNTRPIDWAIGR
jgi:hypothetical protein